MRRGPERVFIFAVVMEMQNVLLFNLLSNLIRYFLFAGSAYWIFYSILRSRWMNRKIQARFPDKLQLAGEIKNSLVSIYIFALAGIGISLLNKIGYAKIYFSIGERGLLYFACTLAGLILWHDTYFYWTHRLLHHPRFFKFHRTHHLSHNTNPFTAFSFHPVEALVQTGFLIVVFVLPVNFLALAVALLWQMIFNVIGHLGYEVVPPSFRKTFLGRMFNTVTHHNMHHRFTNQNFGLYFSFWDKLLKTNHKHYEQHYKVNANKMFNLTKSQQA